MHLGTKFFLLGRSNILDNEPEGNKIVFCLLKSVPFEPDRSTSLTGFLHYLLGCMSQGDGFHNPLTTVLQQKNS